MRFSFGRLLIPLFTSDFLTSIEHLDITNQSVGERGIDLIVEDLNRLSLTDFFFDGSCVQSFDFLCRTCEKLLSSRLHFCSFPGQDFDRILRLLPSAEDSRLFIAKCDEFARRFATIFGQSFDLSDRVRQITLAAVTCRPTGHVMAPTVPRSRSLTYSDSDQLLPEGFQDARRMSREQRLLFRECLDPDEIAEKDPILILMQGISETLSLESLIAAASSQR
jgi:hypothetical protein